MKIIITEKIIDKIHNAIKIVKNIDYLNENRTLFIHNDTIQYIVETSLENINCFSTLNWNELSELPKHEQIHYLKIEVI